MIIKCIVVTLFFISFSAYSYENIVLNGISKDKAIVTINGKTKILKKGEINQDGILLISTDNREALIEINGEQKKYSMDTTISGVYKKKTGTEKVFIAADSKGHYRATGQINGFNVDFLVDTGATLVAINVLVAKRLGINYKLKGKESRTETASGITKTYIVNLKRLRLGNIELRNVKGSVHEGNFPRTSLLGMSFLGKLDMKRKGNILELQKIY